MSSGGHLASLGFGHPQCTTELDEFSIQTIEEAFRATFKDKPDLEEMWAWFLRHLDPYSQTEGRYCS